MNLTKYIRHKREQMLLRRARDAAERLPDRLRLDIGLPVTDRVDPPSNSLSRWNAR